MENNFFVKSHGLGNEYIVLDSEKISFSLSENAIRRICNVNYGIGTDGILLKTLPDKADFGLKIYNPDGSEAEKSGNGLRIFCKFLYDYKFTRSEKFSVETPGGIVMAEIVEEENGKAKTIKIDMGKAIFNNKQIPVDSDEEEFLGQKITAGDKEYEVNCVSVGNPHCVIIKDELNVSEIKKYGPLLENHNLFPNRINVQFAKIISDSLVEILIWERGAGYTLASGSSSCAVASVMVKRKLTDRHLIIKMQGGILTIEIDRNWNISMTGEVREIASGVLSRELISDLELK
ncbi:MAG: diaminopimelate epimerase [Bacteroidales bacterium]|nr:MAG: diaminopimelate epimerase [Bacteroidales bacterium]